MIDNDVWKTISGWLWAVLLIPVGVLWRKADGALSKDEFDRRATEMKDALERHEDKDEQTRKEQRETLMNIFEKLDRLGDVANRVDATLTMMQRKQRN